MPSLTMDEHTIGNVKDKTTALNDQFQSVFTVEDLIQTLLQNLDNKAPGPDGMHPLVLKHCSN